MFRTQTGRIYKEDWDVLRGSFVAPPRPTGVVATAGVKSVRVVFNTSNGAQQYTAVTSTGEAVTGKTSPITITGLTPGIPVTVTVTATNVAGASDTSARTAPVWPTEGTLTNVPVSDGSMIPTWSGSSSVTEQVNAVTVSNKDAVAYADMVRLIPASQWPAAVKQAARNVAAILYGQSYPAPAARANVTISAEAASSTQGVLASTTSSTATIRLYRAGVDEAITNFASLFTHEVVHLIGSDSPIYGTDQYARGVIEGIADYVLVVMGYHTKTPHRPTGGGANWYAGYDTTAFFFFYVAHQAPTPTPDFVRRLNQQIKSAAWTPSQIASINARGMTVDALWSEYKAWIAAGN